MNVFLYNLLKIILNNEFGIKKKLVKKWEKDIYIYTFFEKYSKDLDIEINRVINEINNLSQTIKIYRTKNIKKSNLKLFLTSSQIYKKNFPQKYWALLKNNFGLGTIFYKGDFIINKAQIFIDIHRTKKIECQKHLIREEITQSLGLCNDINMTGSIFNQKWECITEYNKFDKLVIMTFLNDKIKPGMNKKKIIDIFKSNNL